MNKKEKIINAVKIIVAAAIFLVATLNYKTLSNLDVRVLISGASTLLIAELIIIGVYVLKSILLVLPASLIYISVGLALDTKRAIAVNLIGILIEIIITYFLGKFLGKDAVEKKISSTKFGIKLINMKNKNKNTATFLIRLLPIFPIDFSSLFMGAFDFEFFSYVIFSLLGIAPRVIAFTILGSGIYELIPKKLIILLIIIAIPIVCIVGIIKSKISSKKKNNE